MLAIILKILLFFLALGALGVAFFAWINRRDSDFEETSYDEEERALRKISHYQVFGEEEEEDHREALKAYEVRFKRRVPQQVAAQQQRQRAKVMAITPPGGESAASGSQNEQTEDAEIITEEIIEPEE